MDNLELKLIKDAISEAPFIDDYEVGTELIDEISKLIFDHDRVNDETILFRRQANKKTRNNLVNRITKNAESLSSDMWQILTNQILNSEILKLYDEVASEKSLLEILRFHRPSTQENADIDNFPLPINKLRDLTDIFNLSTQLKILAEAATRIDKEGFGISTNKKTGLPKLSYAINRILLMKLRNTDEYGNIVDDEVQKRTRADIICEIFSRVGISGGGSISIAKNIS